MLMMHAKITEKSICIDLKKYFSIIKRKFEVKEETLKVKTSKIDKKNLHYDKQMLDVVYEIEVIMM